ncbi:MAG: 4Fe-4S dicluster domain-containing protein [Desulfurococcaceae archaeon]
MTRWAMVIDLRRCIGCRACMQACAMENSVPIDYTSPEAGEHMLMWVRGEVDYYNIRVLDLVSDGRLQHIPLLCMHCDDPPCVKVCPTTASYQRPDGIVTVDPARCIGCKSCIAVCPYGARYTRKIGVNGSPSGVVDKCKFCQHLIDRGEQPACYRACPTRAITFGDIDDPRSEVRKLLTLVDPRKVKVLKRELGTRPKVYYIGL